MCTANKPMEQWKRTSIFSRRREDSRTWPITDSSAGIAISGKAFSDSRHLADWFSSTHSLCNFICTDIGSPVRSIIDLFARFRCVLGTIVLLSIAFFAGILNNTIITRVVARHNDGDNIARRHICSFAERRFFSALFRLDVATCLWIFRL